MQATAGNAAVARLMAHARADTGLRTASPPPSVPAAAVAARLEESAAAGPLPAPEVSSVAPATEPAAPPAPPPPPTAPPSDPPPLVLPVDAPTDGQRALLDHLRTEHAGASGRLATSVGARLADIDAARDDQSAVVAAAERAALARVTDQASASRATITADANAAAGTVAAAAAAQSAAIDADRAAQGQAARDAVTDRSDTARARGDEAAERSVAAADTGAEATRADAASRIGEARARSSGGTAADPEVRRAQQHAGAELIDDTGARVGEAAESAATQMHAQAQEVAGGARGIADQLGTSLAEQGTAVSNQLDGQATQAASAVASAAKSGSGSVASARDAALANAGRTADGAVARIRGEAARQQAALQRAAEDAKASVRSAAESAQAEAAADLASAGSQLVAAPLGTEGTATAAAAVAQHVSDGFGAVEASLGTMTTDVIGALGEAGAAAAGELDAASDRVGSALERGGATTAQGLAGTAASVGAGLAQVGQQHRGAASDTVARLNSAGDATLAQGESALGDLLAQHEGRLDQTRSEVTARTGEPVSSLDSRVESAQARAAERASKSWLENQVDDLVSSVFTWEFLAGLVVGLLVAVIIIGTAGTATPFVIMAAGIAAGAAGAAAGTITHNAREGKSGTALFDDVLRNSLIGGLAGGVGAGVYLFGAGVVAGAGLTGGWAIAGGIITLEAAAIISNTVANVAAGRPWDENLLTAMLLAPLIELIAGRFTPKGRPEPEVPIRPEDPVVPRSPGPEEPVAPRRPTPDEPDRPVTPDEEDPRRPRRPKDEPERIPEGVTDEDVHIEDEFRPARDPNDPEVNPGVCFRAGTVVATPSGDATIESLRPGDVVLAVELATGLVGPRRVLQIHRRTTRRWVRIVAGTTMLHATPRHPFRTRSRDGWADAWVDAWVDAAQLEPGAVLVTASGEVHVERVEFVELDAEEATHNLTVEADENYLVGTARVLVHNLTESRLAYLSRPGYRNYTLRRNGVVYYSGMAGPNTTRADLEGRHSRNRNRFRPPADELVFEPGTREYGESRLMEQRLAEQHDTIIGRDGENYRGNRQEPLAADKLPEYLEYEQFKRGCG
ncbi:hypothetical protein FLP10_06450 [Agromyces intestinalis]|uniref:Hint domain-containing protein n=1 Tax=Agromyces intestinalis TaxID=2592652 RepID=A0A5C1YDD6_9MICO|nr:Hint domain-containing protein [Agromyces intestinalis]QEO14101.1 hypothetical protein FLP10_06450 [Agromyces intestinalis]